MIGKLKGLIDSYGEDFVILDVNGVGYVVQCSTRTLQKLPRPGEASALAIETQVREDSIRLFGFESENERDWFRLLQNVQGVGAKVALAILSILPPGELAAAIATQDKAPAFGAVDPLVARLSGDMEAENAPSAVRDAISALVNLGYGRPQAAAAVAASVKKLGEGAETGALIRQGLKELAA